MGGGARIGLIVLGRSWGGIRGRGRGGLIRLEVDGFRIYAERAIWDRFACAFGVESGGDKEVFIIPLWKSSLVNINMIKITKPYLIRCFYNISLLPPRSLHGDCAKIIYCESLQQLWTIMKSLNHYGQQLSYYRNL